MSKSNFTTEDFNLDFKPDFKPDFKIGVGSSSNNNSASLSTPPSIQFVQSPSSHAPLNRSGSSSPSSSLTSSSSNTASSRSGSRSGSIAAQTTSNQQRQSLLKPIDTVVALYPYSSDKPHSLSFKKGDTIYVISKLPSGWWEGISTNGNQGWFPSNYIQVVQSDQQHQLVFDQRPSIVSQASSTDSMDPLAPGTFRRTSASGISDDDPWVTTNLSSSTSAASATSNINTRSNSIGTTSAATPLAITVSTGSGIYSANSRKGSIASYESSNTEELTHNAVPSTFTATKSTNAPFESYARVNTTDESYNYPPTYWLPQISSSGKLIYINATRLHVTSQIPWEKVDINGPEKEIYPNSVTVPQDLIQSVRAPTSIASESNRLFDKSVDPYADLTRKSRGDSSVALDYTSVSLETSLMTLQEFEDEDFEASWSEVIEKLQSTADLLEKNISADDEYEFATYFADLAGIVHKISLYIGVPPGAFPCSTTEISGISLAFRRMINTLSRISIAHSIGSMKRHRSLSDIEDPKDQPSEEIRLRTAIGQLVTYAKDLIFQVRLRVQQELHIDEDLTSSNSDITQLPLPDEIETPPTKFEVKYFVDGIWTNIVVSREGQLIPQDSSIPGSLTLLEQKFASSASTGSSELSNRLQLPLETYNTSLTVDSEVISVLEMRIKTVKNILTQFVKLSNTPPSAKSVDVTQDRRKILGSSLQALINVSRVIVNIIESIDLTAFYACRASVEESHSTMTRLLAFLEAKQAIYDALAELAVARRENEAGNNSFIAALSERFEQAKLEEIYFSYEQTNEQQIKDKVFKLDGVLAHVVESAKNLSNELNSIVSVDSRLLATSDATSFPRELAAAAAAAVSAGSTTAHVHASGAVSPRTSYSARRKESAVDSSSIGSHSIRDEGPWFLQLEHGEEIVYDKKGSSIRGGSQRALVEQLTLHSRLNSEFNVAMLLTFQSFMDATSLFEQLVERFLIQPPEGLTSEEFTVWVDKKQRPTRLRVVNILKTWLENYWFEDDSEDLTSEARSSLFESMSKFSEQLKLQKFPGGASLYNIVEKRMNDKEPSFRRMIVTTTTKPPSPILPRNLKKFKLTEIDPVEMARQLSVREFKLLVVITSHECLLRGCGGHGKSPNSGGRKIGEFIRNSNCLTNWVSYAILRHSEAKRRAATIRYFIHVAEACRSLNNFSSMTAIISALFSSTIHRMKKTWDYVSSKNSSKLENMNRLMNSSRNFNEYRDLLNLVPPPAVPFFGVYLTDLTFVEDGNPDYLDAERKMVNFAKRMKTATIIESIRQFQIVPYNFEELADVQIFLDRGFEEAPPIEEQYDTSLNFEPREKPGSDKVAKLFEENGIL